MAHYNKKVNSYELLEKIRKLLDLSIEDMCDQMNWPNSRYYDYMKNGKKRPGVETKKPTSPTVNKIFDGFNYAIENYDNWKVHAAEIVSIAVRELFKSVK